MIIYLSLVRLRRFVPSILILITIGLIADVSLNFTEAAQPSEAKSYNLRSSFKEGDTETIIYKLEATADVTVPSMPKHSVMPLYSRLEQEIEQQVLKISDTQISRLERTYLSSKYYTSKSSKTPKSDSLEGKKVIIECDGTVTSTDKISPEIKKFLSVNEHRFELILPQKEIQLKYEWEVPKDIVVRIFNFSNNKKRSTVHGCTEIGINASFTDGKLKCTLKGLKTISGQEFAIIEMIATLKGEDNGLNIDTALKGTGDFDVNKGRFRKIELSGEIFLDGVQPCTKDKKNAEVTGKGKIKIFYEFK